MGWRAGIILALLCAAAWADDAYPTENIEFLGERDDPAFRARLIRQLISLDGKVVPELRECLRRDDVKRRDDALRVLAGIGKNAAAAAPEIHKAMDHVDAVTRCLAAIACIEVMGERAQPTKLLLAELSPMADDVESLLWEILDDLRGRYQVAPALWNGFRTTRGDRKKCFACAVASAAGRTVRDPLIDFLDERVVNSEGALDMDYVRALAHVDDRYDKKATQRLQDMDPARRLAAIEVFLHRAIIPDKALELVMKATNEAYQPTIREAARRCVRRYLEGPELWEAVLQWKGYKRASRIIDDLVRGGYNADSVRILHMALDHEDWMVQRAAVEAAGRFAAEDSNVRAHLMRVFEQNEGKGVQWAAVRSLAKMAWGAEQERILQREGKLWRERMLEAMARSGNPDSRVYPLLLPMLGDDDPEKSELARNALVQAPRHVGVPVLRKALARSSRAFWGPAAQGLLDWSFREDAELDSLSDLKPRLARLGKLAKYFEHVAALHLLWRLGDHENVARLGLHAAMTNEDLEIRVEALIAISILGERAAVLRGSLRKGLEESDADTHALRIYALVRTSNADRASIELAIKAMLEADDESYDRYVPACGLADERSAAAWLALYDGKALRQPWRVAEALLQRKDDLHELVEPSLGHLRGDVKHRRELAAWFLGCVETPGEPVIKALRVALVNGHVRSAGWALGMVGEQEEIDALVAELDHPSREVRLGVLDGLKATGEEFGARHLEAVRARLKKERDPEVRYGIELAIEAIEPGTPFVAPGGNSAIGLGGGAPREKK